MTSWRRYSNSVTHHSSCNFNGTLRVFLPAKMVSSSRSVVPTRAVCFRLHIILQGYWWSPLRSFCPNNCCRTEASCSCRPTTCWCKWVARMLPEWLACWVAKGLHGWLPLGKGEPLGTDGLLACCGEWVVDGFDDAADPMLFVREAAILEGASCKIGGSHCVDTLTGPVNSWMAGGDVGWVDVLAAAKKEGMPWDSNNIWEEKAIAMLQKKCYESSVLRLKSVAGDKCCEREVLRENAASLQCFEWIAQLQWTVGWNRGNPKP